MLRQTRSKTALVEQKEIIEYKHLPPNTQASHHEEKKSGKSISDFNLNYDDSSDEDTVDKSIASYDIAASWKQREKKKDLKPKSLVHNDELYSFVAHAAGIKLFYSSEVNQHYYPKKHTVLRESKSEYNAITQLTTLINTALTSSTDSAFDSLELFLKRADFKMQGKTKLNFIKNKILSDCKSEFDELTSSYLFSFITWLKHIKFDPNASKPDKATEFETKINILLINIAKKYFSFGKSVLNREALQLELLNAAQENVTAISEKLFFNKIEHAVGKEMALDALDKLTTPYQNVVNVMKSALHKSPARGYVHNMLLKELEDKEAQDKLLQAYIEDLMTLKQSKSKKTALNDTEKSLLKKYLSVSNDAALDELSTNFTHFLKVSLEDSIMHFRRPTLSESHIFRSSNPLLFYANLRLANRSQNRQSANLKHSIFHDEFVTSRIWKMLAINHEGALETQRILGTSFGRKDFVEAVGNYEKVYHSIERIKEFFSEKGTIVGDKHIAEWIREIFQGKTPKLDVIKTDEDDLLRKLQAIAYLLLGCEATRNPAMHVINQMLLDLIIANDDWTFEEALTGKKDGERIDDKYVKRMPMAPEGAVAVARYLSSDLRNYMPYHYSYPGVEEKEGRTDKFNKEDLIKYEARIVREWLKQMDFIPIKSSKEPAVSQLLNFIENHISGLLKIEHPVEDNIDQLTGELSLLSVIKI